jgi:hypothetical protein
MNEDIVQTTWLLIGCITVYKVASILAHRQQKSPEGVWRVIHKTCSLNDFKKELDMAKKDILGTFYEGPVPDIVSIVNAQEIIRSRIGRLVVFSTKDLNMCYNILSNSDWNCIQDRTTFALVTDLKSYSGPCEVSFDIELLL